MHPVAKVHLRRFCAHENSEMRAAAVGPYCRIAKEEAEPELQKLLQDPESKVRVAAAVGLFQLMDEMRPDGDDASYAVHSTSISMRHSITLQSPTLLPTAGGILRGLVAKEHPFSRTAKRRRLRLKPSMFSAVREELTLFLLLMAGVCGMAVIPGAEEIEAELWSAILAAQSLPYLAAVVCAWMSATHRETVAVTSTATAVEAAPTAAVEPAEGDRGIGDRRAEHRCAHHRRPVH